MCECGDDVVVVLVVVAVVVDDVESPLFEYKILHAKQLIVFAVLDSKLFVLLLWFSGKSGVHTTRHTHGKLTQAKKLPYSTYSDYNTFPRNGVSMKYI